MDNVQPNGEPKKIYLTKPPENSTTTEPTGQPTTSAPQCKSFRNCSGDAVRIPPRRHMPPVDKNGEEHITNHKKQRYWNSWEELYLVELWRRYRNELTVVNVPLPVYRKMMIAMRNRNMVVTAQDCRRKINTINSRYKLELQRMESTGCKSEWRLFPLVHCVLQPKIKEYDPWHETAIIQKILDKLPKPVEVESPVPALVNHNNNNINTNSQTPQARSLSTTTHISSYQSRVSSQHTITNISSAVYTDTSSPYNKFSLLESQLKKPSSILPFRKITAQKVEQLRHENRILAKQRDSDRNRLNMEEENFKCFETFIRIWTEQKETELRRVQLITKQDVISLENGENHNMDKQLQETVVTK